MMHHPAFLLTVAATGVAPLMLFLAGRRAGLGRCDDSSVIEVLRGKSVG